MRTALYRHYDANGQLLYVGVSLSAVYRLSQHRRSGWAQAIARVDIKHYSCRAAALTAERKAIYKEKPRFNIAMNNRREEPSLVPFVPNVCDEDECLHPRFRLVKSLTKKRIPSVLLQCEFCEETMGLGIDHLEVWKAHGDTERLYTKFSVALAALSSRQGSVDLPVC